MEQVTLGRPRPPTAIASRPRLIDPPGALDPDGTYQPSDLIRPTVGRRGGRPFTASAPIDR
jgi:hypothetical protein